MCGETTKKAVPLWDASVVSILLSFTCYNKLYVGITKKTRCFRSGSFYFYIILTSILTPDGNDRLVNASITFGAGFNISITRLWVRISNCSRASL